jgi:hypothetical protein
VIKPWWMRFFKALELAVCGAIHVEGEIRDLEEANKPSKQEDLPAAGR